MFLISVQSPKEMLEYLEHFNNRYKIMVQDKNRYVKYTMGTQL